MGNNFDFEMGSVEKLNENESLIYDKYNNVVGRTMTYGENTKYYDLNGLEIAHEERLKDSRKTLLDNSGNRQGYCVESKDGYNYYDNTYTPIGSSNEDNMLGNALLYKDETTNMYENNYSTNYSSNNYTTYTSERYHSYRSEEEIRKDSIKEEFKKNTYKKAILPPILCDILFAITIVSVLFFVYKAVVNFLSILAYSSWTYILYILVDLLLAQLMLTIHNKLAVPFVYDINYDWAIKKIKTSNDFLNESKSNMKRDFASKYGPSLCNFKDISKHIDYLNEFENICDEIIKVNDSQVSMNKIYHLKKELGTLIMEFNKLYNIYYRKIYGN